MEALRTKIWNGERLGLEIACDTETTVAPFHTFDHKLVLFQAYDGNGPVYLVRVQDVKRFMLRHYMSTLVWHNAVFDLDVILPFVGQDYIYELIDNSRIRCTKLMYMLTSLAYKGSINERASLKMACKEFLGVEVVKGPEREDFGRFEGQPIENIPSGHIEYAALDVIHTFNLYCTLLSKMQQKDKKRTLLTHDTQLKGDYALYRCYKNGIGFDLDRKNEWMKDANAKLLGLQERLSCWGWVRGQKGCNDRLLEAIERIGIADQLPLTETGQISKSTIHLEAFKDKPFVGDYIEFVKLEKLSQFVREVEVNKLHPRYSPLKVTGRTGCSKINFQQLPKEGGIREMFVPKSKDNVLIDVDYAALELATLSQVCLSLFNRSGLANAINDGLCPHVKTASLVFNKDGGKYTKENMGGVTKKERQLAKIANFGLGANMGVNAFAANIKAQGETITLEEAATVKEKFLKAYPEIKKYYDSTRNNITHTDDEGRDRHCHMSLTGRVKANCSYTEFLNIGFQGLAADGAKIALYEATKAGLEVVGFVHDSIVIEAKRDTAKASKALLEDIMIKGMQSVVKDVKISVDGEIKERYS